MQTSYLRSVWCYERHSKGWAYKQHVMLMLLCHHWHIWVPDQQLWLITHMECIVIMIDVFIAGIICDPGPHAC